MSNEKTFTWTDELVLSFLSDYWMERSQDLPDFIKQFKASHVVKEKERDWEICECYYGDIQNVHSYIPEDKEDSCIKRKCSIYSVRRISDNSVWTLRDIYNGFTITHFKIKDGDMYAHFAPSAENNLLLSQLKAPIQETPKPVLFTTEDGIEVKDEHAGIYHIADFKIRTRKAKNTTHLINKKFFYIKNAEKYLLFNKPCLSINEIFKLIDECRGGTYIKEDKFTEELKTLAKEKINKL